MKYLRIKHKLLLISLLPLIFIIFISGYTVFLEQKKMIALAKREGNTINKYIAKISANAIINFDFERIESYLVEASKNEIISYATVYDTEGNILATTRDKLDHEFEGEQSYLISESIWSEGTGQVGRVETVLCFHSVQKEILKRVAQLITFLSVSILIIITIALRSAKAISKPIYHLYDAVRRVKGGDLDTEVKVISNDEIGILSAAFDKMRSDLKDNLHSLKVYQQDLEKQVEIRTAQLHKKNEEIGKNREKLQGALNQISTLIDTVTKEKKFKASYFKHPALQKCWEILKCDKKECPCYGKETMRCWQMKGTHCRDQVQGDFLDKFEDCKKCSFYIQSLSDPVYQIGEQFNNMMFMLERNTRRLVLAFKKLKQSHSTILQQEKMASVGQLAAGVAHEINNPVGFIMSNLSTLGKYIDRLKEFVGLQTKANESALSPESLDELNGERKKLKVDFLFEDIPELIKESIDGAERVKEIVQNLKSFSRLDNEGVKPADINDCLEGTIKIVWNELKYKCEVVKEYGELPLTVCSAQQLNQVFVNLLVNAAQAIEEKGVITIRTWTEDDTIFVSISDTGKGIPEKNLDRLFEPFFTTKEVGKGTGLGLSIVYDIVTKKHNGEISVESEVGKGTAFTIKLPIVEEEE